MSGKTPNNHIVNGAKRTLPRSRRLLKGKTWIEKYDGKNVVRGYAKHFHVDLLRAIKELRILGIAVNETYEQAVQQTLSLKGSQKKLREEQKSIAETNHIGDSDDDFAFIIGYTSGGAPYGVRWEDMPSEQDQLD